MDAIQNKWIEKSPKKKSPDKQRAPDKSKEPLKCYFPVSRATRTRTLQGLRK